MDDFSMENFNSLVGSWEFLKTTKLPIFIYGMGDGALKILRVFDEKNIACAGFFASDEFVRGHYFEGHKVHKLSEIEEILGNDFVIVLAFACGYESLITQITQIANKHILLAPDVPVIGEGLFTKEYVFENFEKIKEVYEMLADEKSKQVFIKSIEFKITGDIKYLKEIDTPSSEAFEEILCITDNEDFVDLGAYNGDTVEEFVEQSKGFYNSIIALEPDKRNFKKLKKNTESLKDIKLYNCASWWCDTTLSFSNSAGRQAMLSKKGVDVNARSVDSILNGQSASFIKFDVEGAEKQAIEGCKNTILKYKPKMKIALYHRNEDIFSIPMTIKQLNNSYKLYMRKLPYIPAWEINLYCI